MAAFGGTSNALPRSRSDTKILSPTADRDRSITFPKRYPDRLRHAGRDRREVPGPPYVTPCPEPPSAHGQAAPHALRVRIGAARPARSRAAAETLRRGDRALRAPQPAGKLHRARAAASGGGGAAAGAAQRGLTHGGGAAAASSSSFPCSRSRRRLSGRRGRAVRGAERSGASAAAARRLRAARL